MSGHACQFLTKGISAVWNRLLQPVRSLTHFLRVEPMHRIRNSTCILLLNHTRLKWCPQPDWLPKPCNMDAPNGLARYRERQSHRQPGV